MAVQHPIHLQANTIMKIYNDENSLKTKKVSSKKQEKRVITVNTHRNIQGKLWPRTLLQAMKEAKKGRKKMKKLMKKKLAMGQGKLDDNKHVVVEWDCGRSIEEDASTCCSLSTSTTTTGMMNEFTSPLSCKIDIGSLKKAVSYGSTIFPDYLPNLRWKYATLQDDEGVKVTGNIWSRVVPNIPISQKKQLTIR